MSYSNVPGYVLGPGTRLPARHRFALATRVAGYGSVVTAGFPSEAAAARERKRLMRRNEWVSPVLERSSAGDYIPVNPKLAKRHAMAS